MGFPKVFGELVNKRRRELGLTLRGFCKRNDIDPGNLSKIERGLMAPPQSLKKRLQYAKALGIIENTDEWLDFCDLAEICAKKIPDDVAGDADLLNVLPLLFRSSRGGEVTEEELDSLIESVRKRLREG